MITPRLWQNDRHFAADILKMIFLCEGSCTLNPNFEGPVNNNSALVQMIVIILANTDLIY